MNDLTYYSTPVSVRIDGQDYPVPERTERLEQQLKAHDARLKSVSQFQSDYDLVEIILGKEAAKQIFPKGEDENLDRLHYIASKLMEVYYQAYRKMEDESYKESLNKIGELSDKVGNLAKLDKLAK